MKCIGCVQVRSLSKTPRSRARVMESEQLEGTGKGRLDKTGQGQGGSTGQLEMNAGWQKCGRERRGDEDSTWLLAAGHTTKAPTPQQHNHLAEGMQWWQWPGVGLQWPHQWVKPRPWLLPTQASLACGQSGSSNDGPASTKGKQALDLKLDTPGQWHEHPPKEAGSAIPSAPW